MSDDLFGVQDYLESATDGKTDRRGDHREFHIRHAMHNLLKMGEKFIQAIHVFTAVEFTHDLQIDPAGEMLCIVVQDQPTHVIGFDLVDGIVEHRYRIGIERIRLAVKFNQGDPVEVVPARYRTAIARFKRQSFLAETNDAFGALYDLPVPTDQSGL